MTSPGKARVDVGQIVGVEVQCAGKRQFLPFLRLIDRHGFDAQMLRHVRRHTQTIHVCFVEYCGRPAFFRGGNGGRRRLAEPLGGAGQAQRREDDDKTKEGEADQDRAAQHRRRVRPPGAGPPAFACDGSSAADDSGTAGVETQARLARPVPKAPRRWPGVNPAS